MERDINRDYYRRQARARKRRARQRKIRALIASVIFLVILLAGLLIYWITWNPVKPNVTLEAGEQITLDAFLENSGAEFVTDISKIDYTKTGVHDIVIRINNREFSSWLTIVDTIAPTATPVEVTTKAGILPDASSCVTDIKDYSGVTVKYKTEPDVSEGADIEVVLVLTDKAGNTAEVKSVIHVVADEEAPVISGAEDKTIVLGESVSYRSGVTVTDNEDENPTLTIDNSKVELDKVGKYEVTYTATDAAGNSSSVTITLTIKEKPSGYVDEATVMAKAQEILASITNESMSKMEVAFAIYRWTNRNIGYVDSSDKSSWIKGAYQAFTKRSGDCYNYFAAAKALFAAAGIETVDVVKSDTSHSRHYWSLINIGTGWYHVDCTPRKGSGDLFFMVTDEELEAYSKQHNNSHIFDTSAYPKRETKSVQDKVDYNNGKIKK